MNPFKPTIGLWRALISCAALTFFAHAARAQQAAHPTGTVSGRVFNPATQEYVRNAEVRVEGTNLAAYSGADGSYVLANVPAGEVTVAVTYTGYDPASARVTLGAGQTATRDFDLKGSVDRPSGTAKESAIVLDRFVVSAAREGNAKAIMDQRAALNVKNVVASDNFGDITGGNIGEFMKYLPGVVIDYNNSDARYARISGLDPRYTGVTIDGMTTATAASASFDDTTRGFEFEQSSIYGIEAIELNKTLTASMDADAPAGRLNLRSKNAFDRKGREITALLSVTGNTYALDFKKTPGPYNGNDWKIRPGFVFSYAESFKERFGVQLTVGANTVYTEQAGTTNAFNYTTAGRGPLITQINFRDAPKLSTRSSFNLATDYKITPRLAFSLHTAGSQLDDGTNNRQLIATVGAPQNDPSSTLTNVIANPVASNATRIQLTASRRNKVNDTITYTPRLEYKLNDLTLTAGGGYSRSRTSYEQFQRGFFTNAIDQLTRISWRAQRSDLRSLDWNLTQTSGPSWLDPRNYNHVDAPANNVTADPQAGRHQVWTGYLDAKKTLNLGLPVQLGAGVKSKLSVYDLEKTGALQWTYIGAAHNQTDPSTVLPTATQYPFNAKNDGNTASLGIPRPDVYALYDSFQAHPDYFSPNTISNYTIQNFSARAVKEQVDAGYVEANTRWETVRFNLGLRNERTRTIGRTQNILPDAVVRAAGFTANTIPFLDYKYRHGQRDSLYGSYENTFLSGGAKYSFTQNLVLQVAGSQAIARPAYNNIAGVITVNETARTVTVPNPDLKPETSDKYFVSLQYYLEPAGTLSVSGYRLFVENMGVSSQTVSAADVGYADDPEYAGFTFLRPTNAPGKRRIDGVDVEYSQQLVFLPGVWRGFSVFGSMSRTIADLQLVNHVSKSANGGIRFNHYKFNAQLRATWVAPRMDTKTASEEVWEYERLLFDFSGSYKINRTYELTLSGRNILNGPISTYSNEVGRMKARTYFGPAWTIGVRGRW